MYLLYNLKKIIKLSNTQEHIKEHIKIVMCNLKDVVIRFKYLLLVGTRLRCYCLIDILLITIWINSKSWDVIFSRHVFCLCVLRIDCLNLVCLCICVSS